MILEKTLLSGVLQLNILENDYSNINDVLDFGSRNNQKRGFLFVSKILGRHINVSPSKIRESHQKLSEKIAKLKLDGPVLFIGLAETAVGLGQGVFEQYLSTKQNKAFFIQSTRHPIKESEIAIKFEESHSHASTHWIHYPKDNDFYNSLNEIKSVVIVDDEQSTGNTAKNLLNEIIKYLTPNIKEIVIASLYDWISEDNRSNLFNEFNEKKINIKFVSLVNGTWEFKKNPLFNGKVPSAKNNDLREYNPALNLGRLGINKKLEVKCNNYLLKDYAKIIIDDANKEKKPILILGTGECVHAPFLLAEEIERNNYPVTMQALSRSPIVIGDAFKSSIDVDSPVGGNINFYLHNAPLNDSFCVICFETKDAAENWKSNFNCIKVWFE